MLRLVLLALVMLATLVGMVYLFRASLRTWAGDHFQWYRRMRGGRWACWNGFWEQASAGGTLMFERGFEGMDIAQFEAVYRYKAFLNWDSTDGTISAREDYTGAQAAGGVVAAWVLGFAAAVLLAHPMPARADSIARSGTDWVRITALPCSDPAVLALLEQAGQDAHDWRAAAAEFGGVAFAACWRPDFPRQIVHMVYGDADQGVIPFGALEPLKQT